MVFEGLQRRILQIILRATYVHGSTSLITRGSPVSWIQVQLDSSRVDVDASFGAQMKKVLEQFYGSSDKEKLHTWSHGGVARAVGTIAVQ